MTERAVKLQEPEVAMFEDRARVLLILPREVLDRARVFTGEAVTKLKGPVSLQMVLRALIDEGLRGERNRAILANIAGQLEAVRAVRSQARRPTVATISRGRARERIGK